MKIFINDKEITIVDTSLKTALEAHGMYFPCQGQKICGRCKITCQDIAPTALDYRFLSQTQIDDGIRLACDKTISEGIKVYFETQHTPPTVRKLEFANIAIILNDTNMNIAILDYDIVSEHIVRNEMDTAPNPRIYLRSLIAKECIELFERYSIAQAQTIAIATNARISSILTDNQSDGLGDLLEASQLMLPAEQVYILPFLDNDIGGDFVCLVSMQTPECIAIKADADFTSALIKDDEIICLSHKNITYNQEELSALTASIQLLLQQTDRFPIFKLTGTKAHKLVDILSTYSYAIEEYDIILTTIAQSIDNNRLRSQFFKSRKKMSTIATVESEEWQELFNLSTNNRNNPHSPILQD